MYQMATDIFIVNLKATAGKPQKYKPVISHIHKLQNKQKKQT